MQKNLEEYSIVIVRIGISFVFLWFGINQLIYPKDFIGYLPDFILLSNYIDEVIMFNGWFQLIGGVMLLLGVFTKPLAIIFTLHLFFIILTLGYNDIAIRDIGLMFATFALFLNSGNIWSIKKYYKRHK